MRGLGLLFCAVISGCVGDGRPPGPDPDAGSVATPDAATTSSCTPAGGNCERTSCCGGAVCIDATDGIRCADTCTSGAQCSSGCCAPVDGIIANVCSPTTFCAVTHPVHGDACRRIAPAWCARYSECETFPGARCADDFYASCCGNRGTCAAEITGTADDVDRCVSDVRTRSCALVSSPPPSCIATSPP